MKKVWLPFYVEKQVWLQKAIKRIVSGPKRNKFLEDYVPQCTHTKKFALLRGDIGVRLILLFYKSYRQTTRNNVGFEHIFSFFMHHRNFFVEKGGISAIGRELRQRHNKAQVRTFVQAQLLFVMWWWWCCDSAKGRKYFRLDTFFLFQQQRFFVYIYRYVQKAELSLLWKYVV